MPIAHPILSTRPAQVADLDEVVGFVQNADELFYCYPRGSWPLSIDQLAAAMAERRDSTVVCLDERVAGFANFYQWQHGEYCALGNLMVAPWARGQGVAQHLIEAMETLARQHYNACEMRVSCFNANSAGLLLYPRLGYQLNGLVERQNRHQQRVALLLFCKRL